MKQFILFLFMFLATMHFALAQQGEDCADCPEEHIAEQIKIFPNPASDYIKMDAPEEAKQLYVFNVIGRKVKTFRVEDQKMYQIDELPRGMYLVQVLNKEKHILTTKRIDKR